MKEWRGRERESMRAGDAGGGGERVRESVEEICGGKCREGV